DMLYALVKDPGEQIQKIRGARDIDVDLPSLVEGVPRVDQQVIDVLDRDHQASLSWSIRRSAVSGASNQYSRRSGAISFRMTVAYPLSSSTSDSVGQKKLCPRQNPGPRFRVSAAIRAFSASIRSTIRRISKSSAPRIRKSSAN